jgi:hypothetical protein
VLWAALKRLVPEGSNLMGPLIDAGLKSLHGVSEYRSHGDDKAWCCTVAKIEKN